jgi:hypothetical protein
LRAVPRLGVPGLGHDAQTHAGGDKLFVDYAGDTVPVIVDRLTGKIRPAQIFVAVLGASNFTYADASWTQALADWIGGLSGISCGEIGHIGAKEPNDAATQRTSHSRRRPRPVAGRG